LKDRAAALPPIASRRLRIVVSLSDQPTIHTYHSSEFHQSQLDPIPIAVLVFPVDDDDDDDDDDDEADAGK
jgi:hypothetical protein